MNLYRLLACNRQAATPLGRLLHQIGIQPHFYIFLQIAVEKLVVIQVVHSVGKDGQHRRVFLRGHIGHLQSTADGIDIGASEMRNLRNDASAVVSKTGTQILSFAGGSSVGFPVKGIDGQGAHTEGN